MEQVEKVTDARARVAGLVSAALIAGGFVRADGWTGTVHADAGRLISAIVDRLAFLAADEWMARAAEEIAASWLPRGVLDETGSTKLETRANELRAILWKHREGNA